MGTAARRRHYSYEEYLRALEGAHIKLEFFNGEIYAMAGGTIAHGELSAAIIEILRRTLKGQCGVFTSDVKIRVDAADLSTFPDASAVCGERKVSSLDPHALTNPSVLVEVTSKSTEDYDRGDKLRSYQKLPSVNAILFISHRSRRISVVRRTEGGWDERDYGEGEDVVLAEPGVTFAVDEVYRGVTLDPA